MISIVEPFDSVKQLIGNPGSEYFEIEHVSTRNGRNDHS